MYARDRQYSAFADEYTHIKEAALRPEGLIQSGASFLGGLGRSASRGWSRAAKAGAEAGPGRLSGAFSNVRRMVRRASGKQLGGAALLAGGTGLATYGASRAIAG